MLGETSWSLFSEEGELDSTWIIWEKKWCSMFSWMNLLQLTTALFQVIVYRLYLPFWLFLSWPERNAIAESYWMEMPNSRASAFCVGLSHDDALLQQLPGYDGKQIVPSAKYFRAWFVPLNISNVNVHGAHLKKAEMEPSDPMLPVSLFWRYTKDGYGKHYGALRWSCVWG